MKKGQTRNTKPLMVGIDKDLLAEIDDIMKVNNLKNRSAFINRELKKNIKKVV